MNTAATRRAYADLAQGFRVDRAAASLPQSDSDSIFTVSTGRVIVTLLVGEVTTVIQNQSCTLKVTLTPTTGTAGDVADTLDIDNDEVGTLYLVEGDGTALVGVTAGGSYFAAGTPVPFIAAAGTIDITTGASNTGAIKWSIFYVPLDDGASVAAA